MKSYSTKALANDDGTITIKLPVKLPKGLHDVVVVIGDTATEKIIRRSFNFPSYKVGSEDSHETYRREDIYCDDGR